MLIYNIFVFIVAGLLALDYYVDKHDIHLQQGGNRLGIANAFFYLALGIIIFFAGFRFEVGYDYPKYFAGYFSDGQLNLWEPLFQYMVRIVRFINFGLELQAMFFFFSFLTILIAYKAIKNLSLHYRTSFFLYLLIPYLFLMSFSTIRQALAAVILLYGFSYIAKDKVDYKKYIMIAVVASLIHSIAIVVAIIYLIGAKFFRKNYSLFTYLFVIIVSYFASFAHLGKIILLQIPGHFGSYAHYMEDVNPIKLLVVNVFFIFLMSQKQYFVKTKLDHYALNSILLGLLLYNILSDFLYASRIAQYFYMLEIVLVPIYLYSINNSLTRKIMMFLFFAYYLAVFNMTFYKDQLNPTHSNYRLIPYRNYFFELEKSYRSVNLEAWYNFIEEHQSNTEEKGTP